MSNDLPDDQGPGPDGSAGEAPVDPAVDLDAAADPDAEAPESAPETPDATPEELAARLATATSERDEYLDGMRRLQAEFENYRKLVAKREVEARERSNEALVSELLPILDACDGAVANDVEGVAPIQSALLEVLARQGLERIDAVDAPFDPERHEAVMHDPGESDDGPVVAEVLRSGYSWKSRTLRPAMVRVAG